jgi:uncharacterized protein YecT (DUF1311 family)
MTKINLLAVFVLLLVLSPRTIAAKNCESESNWSAVRACAEGQQTAHLDAVYKDTLAYVSRDNPKAGEWLKKAQAAWLDFAEKSCEFTVASRLPDSNDLRMGCWQSFTEAREKTLKAYKRDHGKAPNDLFHP